MRWEIMGDEGRLWEMMGDDGRWRSFKEEAGYLFKRAVNFDGASRVFYRRERNIQT
jgi:hypothetical protein